MALIIAGGALWGAVVSFGTATRAAKDEVKAPGALTNARIESLKGDLDKAMQYELLYGCTELNSHKQKVLCGASKDKIATLEKELTQEILKHQMRSSMDVEKVKNHIRKVSENVTDEIFFDGTAENPYTENSKKRVEYYKNAKGTTFLVDPTINKVVEFTDESIGRPGNETQKGKALSVVNIKKRAEKYLADVVTDFNDVKKTYISEEANKGDSLFVFRWNAPQKIGDEGMLPFVMVKLAPDGTIVGFSDTRSLYQQ